MWGTPNFSGEVVRGFDALTVRRAIPGGAGVAPTVRYIAMHKRYAS